MKKNQIIENFKHNTWDSETVWGPIGWAFYIGVVTGVVAAFATGVVEAIYYLLVS